MSFTNVGLCDLTILHRETQCCGCSNMMTVTEDKVTARDLSQVIMVSSVPTSKKREVLSPQDIAWQEERRKRKVRKL